MLTWRHACCSEEGMTHHHAAVWLDHNEAKIFHVEKDAHDKNVIHSPKEHTRLHRRSGPGAEAGHRAPEDPHYYREIAQALGDAEEILVVGPATAKLAFIKHVHTHDRALAPRIVGVETVDHPTDGQLVKYIRQYFEKVDALKGN
jgi:hypothetical protein